MTHTSLRGFVLGIFALAVVSGGCQVKDSERCDSTSYYEGGFCWPNSRRADAGAAGSAADAGPAFGTVCKDHPECQGEVVNACLVPDGQTMGVCSAIACDQKPDLCPAGWNCCDLARLRPGAPFACVPLPACP
jgi:hypothetical protein